MHFLLLVALAQSPASAEAWRTAEAEMAALYAPVTEQLARWLSSPSPAKRQRALSWFLETRSPVPEGAWDALVVLLGDRSRRPTGWRCAELLEREQGPAGVRGEGEFEVLAGCQASLQSNAELAARLLEIVFSQTGGPRVCRPWIEELLRAPKPTAWARRIPACDEAVLSRLARSKSDDERLVLLDLLFGASPSESFSQAMAPLLESAQPQVAVRVAGVVLSTTVVGAGEPKSEARERATRILREAVLSPRRTDGIQVVRRLGSSAVLFADGLVARLEDRSALARGDALAALGNVPRWPAKTCKVLRPLLTSDGLEVLEALANESNGPECAGLKPAILALAPSTRLDRLAQALSRAGTRLTPREFGKLDALYVRACKNESASYHDEPNEAWCPAAGDSLATLALEHGFRFWHPGPQ